MPGKQLSLTSTLDPQQDRLLRRADVEFIVGLCKTSIYAAVRAGTFPAPVHVTEYAVAWRKSEIDAWLASRLSARPESGNAPVQLAPVVASPSMSPRKPDRATARKPRTSRSSPDGSTRAPAAGRRAPRSTGRATA